MYICILCTPQDLEHNLLIERRERLENVKKEMEGERSKKESKTRYVDIEGTYGDDIYNSKCRKHSPLSYIYVYKYYNVNSLQSIHIHITF